MMMVRTPYNRKMNNLEQTRATTPTLLLDLPALWKTLASLECSPPSRCQ